MAPDNPKAEPGTLKYSKTSSKRQSTQQKKHANGSAAGAATVIDDAQDNSLPTAGQWPDHGSFPSNAIPLPSWLLDPLQDAVESAAAAEGLSITSTNKKKKQEKSLQELLQQKVPSFLYGAWYHNATIIFLSAVFAFSLGKLGVSLGFVLLCCIALSIYYQMSLQRYRANERNDLQRELSKMKIEADEEPVEWMNSFLRKFWLIFEPVLCSLILENLDIVIGDYLPSFVESVRLPTLTLGTKPFRIESVKTYLNTDPDTVCMDWRVSFIPGDLSDLTERERDRRVNPRIVLHIHMAKKFGGAVLPVMVEDVSFRGHMRVKIRFMSKFPYAKIFEASFLDKPVFDYNLRPFGTDAFGFDVSIIPGLQGIVRDQAHAILGPMMYAPNVFTFDVEKFFAGELDITMANGVLAVTVYSTTPLDSIYETDEGPLSNSARSEPLNPYMRFYLENSVELGRTSIKENTLEPSWNETRFLLLNNLSCQLCLELNTKTKGGTEDERIATAYFDLRELDDEDSCQQEGLDLGLLYKGKTVSDVKLDMRYFPVSKPIKREDGTIEPAAESNSGVLRLTVHECDSLIGTHARVNPYVRVTVNGQEKIKTSVHWLETSPVFEVPGEVVVLDRNDVFIRVEVKDKRNVHEDDTLGSWTANLSDIFKRQEENEGWWQLTREDEPVGHIRFSAEWKPVVMTGLTEGLGGHGYEAPPIGVVRFTFWQARDLRNVENVTGGKSDPYVRVLSGAQVRARTAVVDNNLSPEWGETHYVPIHSPKENLVLEVMDWNARTRDKSLGLTDVDVYSLIKLCVGDQTENPDKWYDPSGIKIDQWVQLRSVDRRSGKGELRYTAEFYPTLALPKPRPALPTQNEGEESDEPVPQPGTDVISAVDTSSSPFQAQTLAIKDLHDAYIKYTPDDIVDLACYACGVLRIKIHQVQLSRHAYAFCQVMADSLNPQYKTARLKGADLHFGEMSDIFIKEADISRVAIEIKSALTDEKDETKLGYWVDNTSSIVRYIQNKRRQMYQQSGDFSLEGNEKEDEGEWFNLFGADGVARIRLSFNYIPMSAYELNPDESIDNQGHLTVTLLRAINLKAADKSGTSDPYVVFTVNGDRVHKSSVVKKSLNPVWKHEQFTVPIQSRVTASFRIEVFDWNQIQGHEPIGSGGITLRGDMVESFAARDVEIPLDGVAGVSGTVRVRFLWQPQLLSRRKTQSTVLGSTTRMYTSMTMSSLEQKSQLSDIQPVASTSSSSLIHEQSLHSRTTSDAGSVSFAPQRTSLDGASTIGSSLDGHESPLSDTTGVPGMLKVSIVDARGLPGVDKSGTSDPYVKVRLGKRSVYRTKTILKTLAPTWDESFTHEVTGEPVALVLKVKDYNRVKKAVNLGVSQCNIWDLVQPAEKTSSEQWLPLSPPGSGQIRIKLEFSTIPI